MPVITVTLIEGYDDATRKRLAARLTQTVRSVIEAPLDGVTVVIDEVKPSNYMRGGVCRTPGAPTPAGAAVVESYLAAMEARDLPRAAGHLADGFVMTFPGGHRFDRPEELVAWAKTRYTRVAKTYERFDEAPAEDGTAVICQGTLHGEWLDGRAFSGIRFVDWFLVRGGKLVEQRVWNDLAEHTAGRNS